LCSLGKAALCPHTSHTLITEHTDTLIAKGKLGI